MRCPECNKDVLGDLKWDNWIKVVNFIRCLELEENITPATAAEMSDCMMSFKTFAMSDRNEEATADLDYYSTVTSIEKNPEILRKEMQDLIEEVKKERQAWV